MKRTFSIFAGLMVLAGCTEQPQVLPSVARSDPVWEGAKDPYVVPGWKAGDRDSWDKHLQSRALFQNEYRRIGTTR